MEGRTQGTASTLHALNPTCLTSLLGFIHGCSMHMWDQSSRTSPATPSAGSCLKLHGRFVPQRTRHSLPHDTPCKFPLLLIHHLILNPPVTNVQEREQQRMAALEAEWRRRERAREADVAAARAEYAALESKAKQVGFTHWVSFVIWLASL